MSTVRIQVRRGLAADWTSVNPILAAGEMGYETDSNKFKFGNGTGAWNTLSYGSSDTPGVTEIAQDAINSALVVGTGLTKTYNDGANTITVEIDDTVWANKTYVDGAISSLSNTADATYVPEADKGAVNGVASLDSNAKVPMDQLNSTGIKSLLSAGNGITFNSTTGEIGISTTTATRGYVDTSISALVDGAPGALDTLKELATALNDDANYATTLSTALGTKAPINDPIFTGTVTIPAGASIAGFVTEDAAAAAYLTITAAEGLYTQISTLEESIQDVTNEHLVVETGLIKDYNDVTNTLTLSVDGTVFDTIAARESAIESEASRADSAITTAKDYAISTAALDATGKKEAAEAFATAADEVLHTAITGETGTAIDAHNSDTTAVHGIANTALLETQSGAQAKADAAQGAAENYADGLASNYDPAGTGTSARAYADSQIDTHVAVTTNVHGIADTTKLVLKDASSTTLDGDLTVSGNLVIEGTTTTVNATDLVVTDPLIYIGEGNSANLVDLGLVSSFNDGTYQHSGIARDASAGTWKIFKGVTDEPTTTINFAQGSLDDLAVNNINVAGVVFTDGTQVKQGVPSLTAISSKTANHTLSSLSERDSMIEMNSASATTLTVAPSSSVDYPIGTSIDILRVGAGAVTVVAGSGVTVNATPGLKLRAQWSSATLVKRGADSWVLLGDLSA